MSAPEEFTEANDRIPDETLPKLLAFYERMAQSWEVTSMQGHPKSVTLTVRFDGKSGPMAQSQAMDDVFGAAAAFGTLVRNLQRERAKTSKVRS